MEAEKKLLLAQNEHGAFLIRDSESRRNDYSLSVRDGDTVKHYRIRQLDEGGFFIARRTTFRTLQELVDHYSRDADGLCVNLRKACIQVSWPIIVQSGAITFASGVRKRTLRTLFFSLFLLLALPTNGIPAGGKRKKRKLLMSIITASSACIFKRALH